MTTILRSVASVKTPIRILIVSSVFIRIALVIVAMQDPEFPRQNDDYLGMAGDWLYTGVYEMTAFPPVYPALNVFAIIAAGRDLHTATLFVLLMQVIFGVLTVLFTVDLTNILTGNPKVALLAGILCSFDPAVIIHGVLILSETLYVFLIVVTTWVVFKFPNRMVMVKGLLVGFLIGLAVLTRSIGIIALFAIVFLSFTQLLNMKSIIRYFSMMILVAVLMIGSWGFRNFQHYGKFFVTISGPYNIAVLIVGPAKARLEGRKPEASAEIWAHELAQRSFDPNDPLAKSRTLAKIALEWAVAHPLVTAKAIARNQTRVWIGPGLASWRDLAGEHGIILASVLMISRVATILGVLGYFLNRSIIKIEIGLFLFFISMMHVGIAGAAAYSRFLVPAIPFLAILAAAGLLTLWEYFKNRLELSKASA